MVQWNKSLRVSKQPNIFVNTNQHLPYLFSDGVRPLRSGVPNKFGGALEASQRVRAVARKNVPEL